MAFINNWQTELTGTLSTGTGMALPVPPAQLAKLAGGVYLLTLSDGDAVEIIRYNGPTGEIEARGLEGTATRTWPVDSVIYAAVTAGQLGSIHQAAADLSARFDQMESRMDSAEDDLGDLYQRVTELEGGGGGETTIILDIGQDSGRHGFYSGNDGNANFGSVSEDPEDGSIIDGVYWQEYDTGEGYEYSLVVMAFPPGYGEHGQEPTAQVVIDGVAFNLDFDIDVGYVAARFICDLTQQEFQDLPQSGEVPVKFVFDWDM